MELQQLKYFHVVAQSEHMTRSAQQLHIAQPALSQSIHRLENELGCQLFERNGRNIRLTPVGRFLDEQVSPLLGRLDTIVDDIHGFSEEERRTVRLDIRAASGMVVEAIACFSSAHPTTRFEVRQHEDDPSCDLRISTRTAQPISVLRSTTPASTQHPRPSTSTSRSPAPHAQHAASPVPAPPTTSAVFTEHILLAVPQKGFPGVSSVSLADLTDERFVCLTKLIRFRAICDELCHAHGFTPTIGCESDNPSVVKKMIGLGLGVGFWPEFSWGSLDDSRARSLTIADEGFARDLVVELCQDDPKPDARRFFEFLTDFLAASQHKAASGKRKVTHVDDKTIAQRASTDMPSA